MENKFADNSHLLRKNEKKTYPGKDRLQCIINIFILLSIRGNNYQEYW